MNSSDLTNEGPSTEVQAMAIQNNLDDTVAMYKEENQIAEQYAQTQRNHDQGEDHVRLK